jgi:phospholipid transport system substrate-binding protein
MLLALAVVATLVGIAQAPAARAQAAPAAPAASAAAAEAPDALVRTVSTEVLDAIKKDKTLQSGDLTRLQALVDEKILPHVNFDHMTQLAVGRGWRAATPEQRQALTREFRTLLVRTYSGAVSAVRDHQVQLRPFRANPADTEVVVRTQVVPSKGDPIQLDYRLEKGEQGWKIFDINILGVWLVENYRNEFASRISQDGVDGLIKSLAERNKAPVADAAKKV